MKATWRLFLNLILCVPLTAAAQQAPLPIQDGQVLPLWSGPAPGGDWAATRSSTLAQISLRSIKQLGGAWVCRAIGLGS